MANVTAKKGSEKRLSQKLATGDAYNYARFRVDLYELNRVTGPEVGERAPAFEAETIGGHKAHPSDYRGRPRAQRFTAREAGSSSVRTR